MSGAHLGWLGIVRLGLVQTALGAIVVLTTSTMNRVMVVEFALPAMLPGALVAIHYAIQILRPRLGFGSDVGGRRTPWIVGGMAVLALGGLLAAIATALMGTWIAAGIGVGVLAFALIGVGVGATGTSLLVLLARRVHPQRRAAAATVVWLMMIAGFIVTTVTVGHLLDPFSPARLVTITATVALAAFVVTLLAVRGVETQTAGESPGETRPTVSFRDALREVWSERQSRRFAIFIFVSMLAYSAQDLILEPFAGTVYGYTPGASTKLSGVQHGGVLLGMVLVAVITTRARGTRWGSLRGWTVAGCAGSAIALAGLATGGVIGPAWPLEATVFLLGAANGAYAVAAIGSMMGMAGDGAPAREGTRMGLWGAAQAIAFGLGGFLGTVAIDVARVFIESQALAYAVVFGSEAALFLAAGLLAAWHGSRRRDVAAVQTHAGVRYAAAAAEGKPA